MKRVYVTRNIPQKALDMLAQECEVTQWKSDDPVGRDELIKGVAGVSGLYCLLTDRIDGPVLEAAGPQLKVVSTMSVGYDHISLEELKNRDVALGYTPDVLTDATAELTVALLLATSRRILEAAQEAKNGGWGSWSPLWMCGVELAGSTVGVVGMGCIGLAVAQRLKGFAVAQFLYTGHSSNQQASQLPAQFVDLDELLKKSDFVICCCALTPQTRGMFDRRAFTLMMPSAIFINTSRGGVVNQDDLAQALTSGQIRAAGLDVTTPEPLPLGHALFNLKNCVILPHIGSATEQTRTRMAVLAAHNLLAALADHRMPAQVQL